MRKSYRSSQQLDEVYTKGEQVQSISGCENRIVEKILPSKRGVDRPFSGLFGQNLGQLYGHYKDITNGHYTDIGGQTV